MSVLLGRLALAATAADPGKVPVVGGRIIGSRRSPIGHRPALTRRRLDRIALPGRLRELMTMAVHLGEEVVSRTVMHLQPWRGKIRMIRGGRIRGAIASIAIICCGSVAHAQVPPAPPVPLTAPVPTTPVSTAPPPDPAVEALVQATQAASTAALMTQSTSEAKANAQVATSVANQVKASSTATAQQKATVTQAASAAQTSATQKQTNDSLCGALSDGVTPKAVCFAYGLFGASLSFVNVVGEGSTTSSVFTGQSNHHLTSVAVPFAGIRFLPPVWAGVTNWGFVSIDIAGYSAFLSQNLGSTSPSGAKVSCSNV